MGVYKLTKVLKRALLLAALGRFAVHEVVKASTVLEKVVDTGADAEDTEGEDPDTDNGNNGGVAVLEPTPNGEAGGEDVDDEDGTGQLPRRDGRPEGSVGTGDEDEPVLSEGDLEEDNLVEVTEVLDDTAVGAVGVHGGDSDPGTDSEDDTEEDGHTPKLGQVPLDRALGEGGVVVGNSQGGDIGENGNEDDKLNVQRTVEDGNPQTKEDLQVDGQSDTVDDVGVHAVENLAGSLQGVNDGTKTGGKEDNVGSGASGVGGTLNGDTSVSLLQGGGIVDTVTSHGNEVATLLKNLNDVVLVLGKDLGETISSLNEVVDLRAGHVTTTTETETLSVVNVGAETELAGSLTSDTDGITSQHLDGQTERLGLVDGAGGVVTGGVRAGHDSENLPGTVVTTLAGNTERAETTGGELSNLVLVGLVNLVGDGVVLLDGLEDEERGTLDTGDALTGGGLDEGSDLLGDRVEGEELDDLVLGEDRLGAGVVAQRLQESLVDGIHTLLLAGSSQAGSKHEVLGVDTGDGNLDTSKGLNSGKLLDNGLLLGKVGSTDSHGGGDDGGKTDGNTNNGNGKGEAENVDNAVGAGENDEDQENGTNAVQDLGEVTRAGGGSVDESGSATDEGVVTSGGNDNESLTTLDGGRGVAVVVAVLVDGQRLTSDGGLVDLEESILGDDAAIGRDNGTLLNLEDITGDNFGGLNLLQSAVTEDDSLEGESLLEFGNNLEWGAQCGAVLTYRSGLEFLNKTNGSVKQQKTANNTKIDPVLKTSGKDGGSLHDELDGTNEEHEELKDEVLLLLSHLVATPLAAAVDNLLLSETKTGVSLELLLRDDAAHAGSTILYESC
ncbi:uncharacterized protein ColSpa_11725 [Colletotrichum spaethianum]|uniref:Uncharacterized protein n=1 Tax=Colletotrichum spaethianum TaxID=700344 RepID=A0AA37PG09_9PEZI|nr:uncharacterized protein ColSpa_11725 [Colletotrichum spaethianum]GKT51544.1 hypothetical protein ColSpa_11725 [Colletotrichum spaethianum]